MKKIPRGAGIFDWTQDLMPFNRIIVPSEFPVLGHLPINKLVQRHQKINDPVLNILAPVMKDKAYKYGCPVWTLKAYENMFEKFIYQEPTYDIKNKYRQEWDFATFCTLQEYSYMEDSVLISFANTTKNADSIPGYPKMMYWNSEREYLDAHGLREYYEVWDKIAQKDFTQYPVWYSFLKMEATPLEKIEKEDYRMIMCTDPVYTRIGSVFEQDQNERLKSMTNYNAGQMGWTPFRGGLHAVLERITRGQKYVYELDWTRFDGTIPAEVLLHIKHLRWNFLARPYKTEENWNRHTWYVESLIDKYVVLPTGEVTLIKRGNPSGQISTTSDNIMVNTFLTAFEYAYQHLREGKDWITPATFFRDHKMVCYGDDRLSGINYTPNFEMIIDMYKQVFGMWVKPEKIKIHQSPEGSSFCGFTFFKGRNGRWVGKVNVEKILSTLKEPVKQLPDLEALWAKLVSLRILVEHSDEETKELLDDCIVRVERAMRKDGITPVKLPRHFYEDMW
uniref:Non-structural polyprotein 1AB n=1 Tax=Hetplan gecko astrovirus TaxID=3141951 RepID=A0AAU7SS20_9VIRU